VAAGSRGSCGKASHFCYRISAEPRRNRLRALESGLGSVCGKVLFFVKDGFGAGYVGKEAADGGTVDATVGGGGGGYLWSDDVGETRPSVSKNALRRRVNGNFELRMWCSLSVQAPLLSC